MMCHYCIAGSVVVQYWKSTPFKANTLLQMLMVLLLNNQLNGGHGFVSPEFPHVQETILIIVTTFTGGKQRVGQDSIRNVFFIALPPQAPPLSINAFPR